MEEINEAMIMTIINDHYHHHFLLSKSKVRNCLVLLANLSLSILVEKFTLMAYI